MKYFNVAMSRKDANAKERELIEQLRSIPLLKVECARCQMYLEELREMLEQMNRFPAPFRDNQFEQMKAELLEDLKKGETQFYQKTLEQWYCRQKAEVMIEALPDLRERLILHLRYLDGLSWDEVIEGLKKYSLFYEQRQVARLHKAAIAALAERFGEM